MTIDLHKKNAIITGGASGIGKAITLAFAKAGAKVHIIELDKAAVMACVAEIANEGGEAHAYTCDVSDHDHMAETVVGIVERHGIDILVNNAGIAHIGNIAQTSPEDFDRLYHVNVKGVYNGMRACLPHFLQGGGGVVLNVASIAAHVGLADRFAYTMTKGAVVAMTYAMARDYAHQNIRCNSISPARVHTPLVDGFLAEHYPGREADMFAKLSASQPLGRMGKPEEVANLALYLCSDQAGFITGADYPIDGGLIKLKV